MAISFVPIQQSTPNYRIGVTLVGVAYWLDLRWNTRDAAWYLDVYDANEKPICNGIKIVIGTFLGRTCNVAPFTQGVFVAFDTSGAGLDAGFDDFGKRVQLAFLPVTDLLAVEQLAGVT